MNGSNDLNILKMKDIEGYECLSIYYQSTKIISIHGSHLYIYDLTQNSNVKYECINEMNDPIISIQSISDYIVLITRSNRIHIYNISKGCEYITELRDVVNRSISWSFIDMCIDGDYILCIGIDEGGNGVQYIWNIHTLVYIRIPIQDQRNCASDLMSIHWNEDGILGLLYSTSSNSSYIHTWTRNIYSDWSGFTSNFVEIMENEYYEEPEDEFDHQIRSGG